MSTTNPFNAGLLTPDLDGGGLFPHDPGLLAEALQPRPIERPVPVPVAPGIRVPRSAARPYTPGDLSAAAAMLALLRRGAEPRPLPPVHEADHALDVAVDRLLDVL